MSKTLTDMLTMRWKIALILRFTINEQQMRLILYQRDDCHLCDEALQILAAAQIPDFDSVWIDDDAALEARYGIRVPVLRDEDSARELGWPFGIDAVRRFVDQA
jgi:glutaredoxin